MANSVADFLAKQKAEEDRIPPPPDYRNFLLDVGLYEPVPFTSSRDQDWVEKLKFGDFQFDAYCPSCSQKTTFRTFRNGLPEEVSHAKGVQNFNSELKVKFRHLILEDGHFSVSMACQRKGHAFVSYLFFSERTVQKVGQYPSLEDIAGGDIDRYRKILGANYSEMRKAGGLFSHGIGIGAFVYLRRIFERLIEDARAGAQLDEAAFYQKRMVERVDDLKHVLPASVVRFKAAYGILSKGVHELSEEECKRFFPVIRAAIIMMLEERYEAEQKRLAANELESAFASIQNEIK